MANVPTTITTKVKDAIKLRLMNLPATSNGTVVQAIAGSAQDAFEQYPTVRVVPVGIERNVDSATAYEDYTLRFVITLYLDLGDAVVPDEEVIETMCEIMDNIVKRLDNGEWLPDEYGTPIIGTTATSVCDTLQTKNGTVLYCDLEYPITFRKSCA